MNKETQLTEKDQARVDEYLQQPIHQVKRKHFRFWLLLLIIVLVMTGLSLFSYFLAYIHGVV